MTGEEEIRTCYKRLKNAQAVADELNFPIEWVYIVVGKK